MFNERGNTSILLVIAIILIAAAAFFLFKSYSSAQLSPSMTSNYVNNSPTMIQKDSDIDSSLSSLDKDLSGVDSSLNEKQEALATE